MAQVSDERMFAFEHKGWSIDVTIWNEHSMLAPPQLLFDFNNVLNAHKMHDLMKAARVSRDTPFAIVSLLATKGEHFTRLRDRAQETGECIVALTAKIKGDRKSVETGMKNRVMHLLHWENDAKWAIDDKPHEWFSDDAPPVSKPSVMKLDPSKKPVYCVRLC